MLWIEGRDSKVMAWDKKQDMIYDNHKIKYHGQLQR